MALVDDDLRHFLDPDVIDAYALTKVAGVYRQFAISLPSFRVTVGRVKASSTDQALADLCDQVSADLDRFVEHCKQRDKALWQRAHPSNK